MNILQISVENDQVISRYNGEGSGTVLCSYINEQQVSDIISANNESERVNPSPRNPTAIRL